MQRQQPRTFRYKWRRLLIWIRQALLEHRANDGLGGPPNNWSMATFYSRGHGTASGAEEYTISFDNDAFDIAIACRWNDDGISRRVFVMAAEDFRKLALWYLWRWIFGEWFGLRRKLFYTWLRRQ